MSSWITECAHLMKLALIHQAFAPFGGAELYLQRLMRALAAAGHEIHLIAQSWGAPSEEAHIHLVTASSSRANALPQFAAAALGEIGRRRFDCVFSCERIPGLDVYRAA